MSIISIPSRESVLPGRGAKPAWSGAMVLPAKPAGGDRPALHGLHLLSDFAGQRGLELRLHALPEGGGTVIQLVDPHRKEVVREFPAEDLRRVLKAIFRRSGASLDEQA